MAFFKAAQSPSLDEMRMRAGSDSGALTELRDIPAKKPETFSTFPYPTQHMARFEDSFAAMKISEERS